MSSCAAYMEKNLKVTLILKNVSIEEIAAIKEYLAFYRKESRLWRKEK